MYKHFFKRLIDFVIVFCALLVIWPILLVITIWLHFANKGAGAFFTQERPGKNGKIFKVIKFKSMTDERDANGELLPDAQRLTKVGRFVRATSIDELPQLFNVLKGDMALIGPRPLDMDYYQLYTHEHMRRHEVRPGITGWAQVHGRNDSIFSEKFSNDVWYVDHLSFGLDLKILMLTILKVVKRSDVGTGSANMRDVDDLHFLDRILGNIREFGSDFHLCRNLNINKEHSLKKLYPTAQYTANGRTSLEYVLISEGYKRIWVPKYFCYEVVEHLESLGIEVCFYNDFPANSEDEDIISKLPFNDKDVVLRLNYFGLRAWRDNSRIPVPVIEDHSHDCISEWALNSNADWCIASLRKTLPIAAGGMLWSPKERKLPAILESSVCEEMAEMRYKAMDLKDDYLRYGSVEKDVFRKLYLSSEQMLEQLKVCSIDRKSIDILSSMDIYSWTQKRKDNYNICKSKLADSVHFLVPEDEKCNPFSLVILLKSENQRDVVRKKLIENSIYPAILWTIPTAEEMRGQYTDVVDVSSRMLSLHIDGRYDEKAIVNLCSIVNGVINDSIV